LRSDKVKVESKIYTVQGEYLSLEPKHTIFCIQELLVCWEITLYFAFIWTCVPEKQDRVKGAIYSAENLSNGNLRKAR